MELYEFEVDFSLQDDGLHIRHRCFDAIQEELQELKEKVAQESSRGRQVEEELKKMREKIRDLKKLLMPQPETDYDRLESVFHAIEEELRLVKEEFAGEANSRNKMEDEMKKLREEFKEIKQIIMFCAT